MKIESGKRYKIVKPFCEEIEYRVGVGDIIEVTKINWIGVYAKDITLDRRYDAVIILEGSYSQLEYFELIKEYIEEVTE